MANDHVPGPAALKNDRVPVKTVFLLLALAAMPAAPLAQSYKGLELKVAGVERATNVSLTDCPPGQNIVRGVIKPGDTNEFASVKIDFAVSPSFKPTQLASPVLHDDTGKTYKTAQSFAEIAASSNFSCAFSFRVPKGTKLARVTFDTVALDLRKVAQ